MVATNPQKIAGIWTAGYALDIHTVSSTYLGVDQFGRDRFDTVRTELGELLLRLKYKNDTKAAEEIIAAASGFLKPHRKQFDLIVPVPPSKARAIQPVMLLARGIGAALDIPVVECVTTTRDTEQLKGVFDPETRKKLLDGLHAVDMRHTANKNVLLFDDLFRSGSTMNAITALLSKAGMAASVRVFTITRTRSNQ